MTYSDIDFNENAFEKNEYIECTFNSCNFSNVNLTQIDFVDCDFEECNFSNANLNYTGFKTVNFRNCKMLGLDFSKCNDFLFGVFFEKCVLDYAIFFRKRMKKTKFLDCSMRETDFTQVELGESSFLNCDLSGTHFMDSNIEKVDFRTAFNYSIDLDKNKIKKAKFGIKGAIGLLSKYDISID